MHDGGIGLTSNTSSQRLCGLGFRSSHLPKHVIHVNGDNTLRRWTGFTVEGRMYDLSHDDEVSWKVLSWTERKTGGSTGFYITYS